MSEGKLWSFKNQAQANLVAFIANHYPGRGLIVGLADDGKHLVQVYWIMGRSENSRNRTFVAEGDSLRTTPADSSKVTDPSLIIYRAMAEVKFDLLMPEVETGDLYAVSNGVQTDIIIENGLLGINLYETMLGCQYEPDSPNFTPRISAVIVTRPKSSYAEISVLKKSEFGGYGCDRFFYRYTEFHPGIGHCVTTYSGDGNPLPSFRGEPYLLPLTGDIESVARTIWDSLNEANRISLAVKFITTTYEKAPHSEIKVINKYSAVA